MAPAKKSTKTQECEVAKIGPIYPVFVEKKTKKAGKIIKRLVLKEKRVWVQWKSAGNKEEWTAEPLSHFSGDAKKKAEKSIKKGECWPWKEQERIAALKTAGMKQYQEPKTYNIVNHLQPVKAPKNQE